jgi:hypothetical protein
VQRRRTLEPQGAECGRSGQLFISRIWQGNGGRDDGIRICEVEGIAKGELGTVNQYPITSIEGRDVSGKTEEKLLARYAQLYLKIIENTSIN